MKKETSFKLISISLPFIMILIIEVILRIVGYGENYSLFNKVSIEGKPDYLEMNPMLANKYFSNTDFNSDNQFDLFLKTKTDSTFRIFIQGASTTVGFPFYRGGSFPRMLKHRLALTFQEKNIEVINTGITAVNSYTLWDLTDQIIEQQPDLVIIYAGHNEYYGALGVGASGSLGSQPSLVRAYLSLKDFRFFQLLEKGYVWIANARHTGPDVSETTLMEVMVEEQRIPLNSEVYRNGIKQFTSNLEQILAKYKGHNIPVILSTLVSNEKDIKPFISDSIKDEKAFNGVLEKGDLKAHELAQSNALAAYKIGQYHLSHVLDTAKKYLHQAKELDLLRFRAPEEINKEIEKLALKYNCTLVDMREVFLSHSPKGIIGNELMTEHVHPNIKGYFLMADAFYEKINASELIGKWTNYIAFEEAYEDIPVTKIDSMKGKFIIEDLKKSWPYDLSMAGKRAQNNRYLPKGTYEEKMALSLYTHVAPWKEVMKQAYNKYYVDEEYEKALHVAQSLIFEYPEEAKLYQWAGEMCEKLNMKRKATYYFAKYNQLKM